MMQARITKYSLSAAYEAAEAEASKHGPQLIGAQTASTEISRQNLRFSRLKLSPSGKSIILQIYVRALRGVRSRCQFSGPGKTMMKPCSKDR